MTATIFMWWVGAGAPSAAQPGHERQEDTEVVSPNHGSRGTEVPPVLPSIPLSREVTASGDGSIGNAVSEATRQVSSLVRLELELAKSELVSEVKKGLQGSVFFLSALSILLFSLFFFFFFLAELLNLWLQPWASYLIVFGIMLLSAGLLAFLGFLRVKKIHAPERTISSVKDTAAALRR
jgi:putative superfamily III holin-X